MRRTSRWDRCSRRWAGATEATEHYLEAIAIRPDYWRHYSMIGAFDHPIGRFEDVIAAFTRVTVLLPDNAGGFHNLGRRLLPDGGQRRTR